MLTKEFLEIADVDYLLYLQNETAWSPQWDEEKRGFYFCMVLIPPGLTEIHSLEEYLFLLVKRMEFHIVDWITENTISTKEKARINAYELIRENTPTEVSEQINNGMTIRDVSQVVCSKSDNLELLTKAFTEFSESSFPISSDAFNDNPDEEFSTLITNEVTLEGFLMEARINDL